MNLSRVLYETVMRYYYRDYIDKIWDQSIENAYKSYGLIITNIWIVVWNVELVLMIVPINILTSWCKE